MTPRVQTILVYVLFFLSGVAGLSYEVLWARMFAVGLGHEFPSLLSVVAAFFGGLALGAWTLDGPISRSSRPGLWYAAAELVIGAWAVVTVFLIPRLNSAAAQWIGLDPSPLRHWAVAFGVPLLALLPATAAMGATLPAVDRLCCRLRREARSLGGLYAANTCGAVAGTLLSVIVLMPLLGFRGSLVVLATLNAACALAVLAGPARAERDRPEPAQQTTDLGPLRLRVSLFLTGLLGIGYEVLGVRVLAQVQENTVFSFAMALCVYLLGTAAGAALYQSRRPRRPAGAVLELMLYGLSLSCAAGVVLLKLSGDIHQRWLSLPGRGLWSGVFAEALLALLVFALPSMLMGATFSHLAQCARRISGGVGAALGLNTLGGAVAPVVFGVWLLPLLGSKTALVIVAAGYLVLLPRWRPWALIPSAAVVVGLVVYPGSLLLIQIPPGQKLIAAREGVLSAAVVVDGGTNGITLWVNNKFRMGGTGPWEFGQRRQAHIPLMLHAAPRRALFLGLGTGITFATTSYHEGVTAEGVELLPEVVDLLPHFRAANAAALDSERLTVIAGDARRYVTATPATYDVIVADLFHPARDGSASLYTVEHFKNIRARLARDGLFCQWLPLYQLDAEVLRIIMRSFLEVFPETVGWWGYFNVDMPMFGLVAAGPELRRPAKWYERRVTDSRLREALVRAGLRNELQLFGCLAVSPAELRAFAGSGRLNTDDRPMVAFLAPRLAYSQQMAGVENIQLLLSAFHPQPSDILADGGEDAHQQLADYLTARDLYLQGSIDLSRGRRAGVLKMLRSVRTSPHFLTAYEVLLAMARGQSATNPRAARELLRALIQASPQRPEAHRALEEMR